VPDAVVQALLPLVRRFATGEYGIALGGSHAKGTGDERSDVDIYLFAECVLSADRRRALAEQVCGADGGVVCWGMDEPFVEGGTDFRYGGQTVEVWIREARSVAETIERCLRGEVEREYRAWTVMGFFNYAVLSDVRSMRIVDDPSGMLEEWKRRVAEYPPALRRAIVARFLAEAKFWPGNVHYRSAVERGDAIYAAGIAHQVACALVQVVFALNEVYFPGEKRLARALGRLPAAPRAFAARVEALLWPGAPASVAELCAQARELDALVEEVEALASAAGPGSR
jgi:hypothetical protein